MSRYFFRFHSCQGFTGYGDSFQIVPPLWFPWPPRKSHFHDDLSVAEAVGVADLTDEVQYPFLSWKFCVDGYIPNIDKLFWIDRLNINGGERIKLCKRE